MRAWQLTGPRTFVEAEVGIPEPGAGEVLLRVLTGGICGSDLPSYEGKVNVFRPETIDARPGYPLHEVVGEVVSGAGGWAPGTRVVGWAESLQGLADYVVTHPDSVVAIPDGWDPVSAIALQPLACVLDITQRFELAGARVTVLGGGSIGLLFTLVAKAKGAAWVQVVDRNPRGEITAEFGADDFVHATVDRWRRLLDPQDAPNLVIEAIGHNTDTMADAIYAVAPEGHVFYFGVPDVEWYPLPMNELFRKSATLQAGNTIRKRAALEGAIAFAADRPGLLERYVTHRVDAAEAPEAFRLATHPAPDQGKVALLFT